MLALALVYDFWSFSSNGKRRCVLDGNKLIVPKVLFKREVSPSWETCGWSFCSSEIIVRRFSTTFGVILVTKIIVSAVQLIERNWDEIGSFDRYSCPQNNSALDVHCWYSKLPWSGETCLFHETWKSVKFFEFKLRMRAGEMKWTLIVIHNLRLD